MFTDWIHNEKHAFLTGNTGAGKTTLARQVSATTKRDLVVVLNPIHTTPYFADCRVSSPNKVLTRIKNGKRKVEYLVGTEEKEEFSAVYSRVKAVAKNTELSVCLIVDEADRFASVHGSIKNEPLVKAIKTARNYGIKIVSISQGLSHINRIIVEQSPFIVWLGCYNPEMEQYYKRYNIPYNNLPEPPENPLESVHVATLIGPNFRVLEEFKPDARYST